MGAAYKVVPRYRGLNSPELRAFVERNSPACKQVRVVNVTDGRRIKGEATCGANADLMLVDLYRKGINWLNGRLTLMHELAHINMYAAKLWNERHGPRFHAEYVRLVRLAAGEGLFDSYGQIAIEHAIANPRFWKEVSLPGGVDENEFDRRV